MIQKPLPLSSTGEANLQIGSGTKHLAGAGDDDAFDSLVQIEHGIDEFKVSHHLNGEGIALFGAVQCDHYHRRGFWRVFWIVAYFDVFERERLIGTGDFDLDWVGQHFGGWRRDTRRSNVQRLSLEDL